MQAADHVDLVFNVLTQAHVGLTPFAANNRSVLVMHKVATHLPFISRILTSRTAADRRQSQELDW